MSFKDSCRKPPRQLGKLRHLSTQQVATEDLDLERQQRSNDVDRLQQELLQERARHGSEVEEFERQLSKAAAVAYLHVVRVTCHKNLSDMCWLVVLRRLTWSCCHFHSQQLWRLASEGFGPTAAAPCERS